MNDNASEREPIDLIDPELRGLAASIGIGKGKKFAPDERMKKILAESAAVGNATARAIFFRNRDPTCPQEPGTANGRMASSAATTAGSTDDGRVGRNLDARASFFYMATVNTPAMATKMVGRGSQYAIGDDKTASDLDGGKSYN